MCTSILLYATVSLSQSHLSVQLYDLPHDAIHPYGDL